jgi:virginiamycin B lyase
MSIPRALLVVGALAAASFSLHAQNPAPRTTAASASQFAPREFEVPYGASTRPRDPFADAQGHVWFVGQNGNYIGRLDPKSGEFKRYEIDPGTNPHNLVVEKGMVWFTGNRNNRLVKLDPARGRSPRT